MVKYLLFILIILFLDFSRISFAQTSEIGNYNVFARKSESSSLGYMRLKFDLDPSIGQTVINYGVSFNHYYDITNLGYMPINDNSQFSIYLTGAFRIGAGIAGRNQVLNQISGRNLTYYGFMVDFYSLSLVPEYLYVLDNGYALTPKLGFNLFNLGFSAGFPKQGVLSQNLIATVNLLPLAFIPSFVVDFGRSSLGLSFYINPVNILCYNYIPDGTYGSGTNQHYFFDQSQRGVKAFSSVFQRYDFQIMFTF